MAGRVSAQERTNEMLPPGIDNVCLQATPWRAKIVKTGNTTVDLDNSRVSVP